MSGLTVIGGARALVVAADLVSGRVFRDWAPRGVTHPYVTLHDITDAATLKGDGATVAAVQTLSVDLWQKLKSEDDSLPRRLRVALDGQHPDGTAEWVWKFAWRDTQRIVQTEEELVHHALTFSVWHSLAAT